MMLAHPRLSKIQLAFSNPGMVGEYLAVRAALRLGGWRALVRYLRNPDPRLVPRLLRLFGADVGQGSRFKGSIQLDNVSEDEDSWGDLRNLRVGKNCYIGEATYFDLAQRITLEDNVVVSAHASFITHSDCNRSPRLSEAYPRETGSITVKAGTWVGFGATLLHGVDVGPNAVVAAHALVRKGASDEAVLAGVPARQVRRVGKKS